MYWQSSHVHTPESTTDGYQDPGIYGNSIPLIGARQKEHDSRRCEAHLDRPQLERG